MELAITDPQSAIIGERQYRSRLQARSHGSTRRPIVGAFDPAFVIRAGSNRMIQQTKSAETKIDLGDGLSLWLSSTQQLAAARYVVN
jgi:hypothetical protein